MRSKFAPVSHEVTQCFLLWDTVAGLPSLLVVAIPLDFELKFQYFAEDV